MFSRLDKLLQFETTATQKRGVENHVKNQNLRLFHPCKIYRRISQMSEWAFKLQKLKTLVQVPTFGVLMGGAVQHAQALERYTQGRKEKMW